MRVSTALMPLLVGLMLLAGCAHTYVMKLSNGTQITTATKPTCKDGIYYFKDAKGEEHAIAAARVREIAPASVAAQENKAQPIHSKAQKMRHWYFLWLA